MTKELIAPISRELSRIGLDALPQAIQASGPEGIRRFLEFFTVTIRNKNTRLAYARAASQFFDWCEARGIESLDRIQPVVIAAYVEQHQGSAPTVKQHLAPMRMLFDWLAAASASSSPSAPIPTAKASRQAGQLPAGPSPECFAPHCGHVVSTVLTHGVR